MIVQRVPSRDTAWDVCVVGCGPVGMAVAEECARLGLDVLVLESGALDVSRGMEDVSRAIIQDGSSHVPMEVAVCRAFGGTSWMWGGRCVPLDDIDFEWRPHVPHSGWPISHDALKPWYSGASQHLLCGSDVFERHPSRLPENFSEVYIGSQERWATEPRLAIVHQTRIKESKKITVCLNSTVTDLRFDEAGATVASVQVRSANRMEVASAREVVIAVGGVETARLLLSVQRNMPSLFGGVGGPLGRYYMGHISGKIADIEFNEPATAAEFDYVKDRTGAYVRRRFTLTELAQRNHSLLNTAFWTDNPPFYDPSHHNAALSAIFLALAFPPIGRRLLAEGTRLYHVGSEPTRYGRHIRNIVAGGSRGIQDVVALIRDRFLLKPRKPAPLLWNSTGRYALVYHSEQEPDLQNRVLLANEYDRFGLARATVTLRYAEGEARRVLAAHSVLDFGLRQSGIARLVYRYPNEELVDRILMQAVDGYHQTGTARMGRDPRTSVVDEDLKVHGVSNLHVASSAVFPTSGQANSTFPAVALAIRLAHHLRRRRAVTTGV